MEELLNQYKKNVNNISYWFPKIKDCGIKVPKTLIFQVPEEVTKAYFMDKEDENIHTVLKFVEEDIIPSIPIDMFFLFVKNGTFSNKYDFSTCRVRKNSLEMTRGIIEQNYNAEVYGAGGLTEIAVREFIGSWQAVNSTLCIYNGMPLRPEFRVFYDFDSKEVLYSVNYWDWDYCYENIKNNVSDGVIYKEAYPELMSFFLTNKDKVEDMVKKAMENVDFFGKWSIDIMYDKESDTYYLIDMALAEQSAYWKWL